MGSKAMQFEFEAWGMNLATKKSFKLPDGKWATVELKRGEMNQIAIGVTVKHTDIGGPDPPKVLTDPPLKLQRGWPFQTRYDFVWDVDVDGDEISILGDVNVTKAEKQVKKGVKTHFKTNAKPKFLEIHAQSKFEAKGLKFDLPGFEGEGDLADEFGLGDDTVESQPAHFLCKLEAEKAEKKTWPKIPASLVRRELYFEVKNKHDLPPDSLRDLQTWANEIKKIPELYDVINRKDGVTIHLDGHTSKSGSKDYNRGLALKRIASVETVLRRHFDNLDIVSDPKKQSKTEFVQDYRVDVHFDKVKAETAMKARES